MALLPHLLLLKDKSTVQKYCGVLGGGGGVFWGRGLVFCGGFFASLILLQLDRLILTSVMLAASHQVLQQLGYVNQNGISVQDS